MTWATGPDSSVPTKLPAIAAAGAHREQALAPAAHRTTDPAIVQAIVTAIGADRVHAQPRQRDGRRVTGRRSGLARASRISAAPSDDAGQQPDPRDPAERCAVGERRDEPDDSERR